MFSILKSTIFPCATAMVSSEASEASDRQENPQADLHERRRELYKYFQPKAFEGIESRRKSPDPTLISYAQLATWRLDARRCTIRFGYMPTTWRHILPVKVAHPSTAYSTKIHNTMSPKRPKRCTCKMLSRLRTARTRYGWG